MSDLPLDQKDAARYERLFRLYEELNKELDQLEAEGNSLGRRVQEAIDKEKMAKIFKTIHQAD